MMIDSYTAVSKNFVDSNIVNYDVPDFVKERVRNDPKAGELYGIATFGQVSQAEALYSIRGARVYGARFQEQPNRRRMSALTKQSIQYVPDKLALTIGRQGDGRLLQAFEVWSSTFDYSYMSNNLRWLLDFAVVNRRRPTFGLRPRPLHLVSTWFDHSLDVFHEDHRIAVNFVPSEGMLAFFTCLSRDSHRTVGIPARKAFSHRTPLCELIDLAKELLNTELTVTDILHRRIRRATPGNFYLTPVGGEVEAEAHLD